MSKQKNSRTKKPNNRRLGEFVQTGHKLTQQELQSHLWGSANILRGSIDASDYKNYIFGLLFLKRLSDVFEEEAERIEKKTGDKRLAWNDPDEHQFFVPERARWSELRKVTQNLGEAINKANDALEEANPILEGVLASVDFNVKDRLPDIALLDLIDHFSIYRLRNEDLSEPDLLGRAYEYLIGQFADDAGKKGGEFYTPRKVVELIVRLIEPREETRICDPACGSGGMLIECANYIKARGGNPLNISLYGQEKNINTWAICKMNMLLHGMVDARIERGDTIRNPKLVKDGQLMLFDRVIANPPFSLKNWGREDIEKDGYGRFKYGMPPNRYGDFAFVQHMIATVNDRGLVGVVMPLGVLFRGGAEERIRQALVEEDLIEAIIGIPPNLFYGASIDACVLVLNRMKRPDRRGKVLFVSAEDAFTKSTNQNLLNDEGIAKIVSAFNEFSSVKAYCTVAGLDSIKERKFNLSISEYVEKRKTVDQVDFQEALSKVLELDQQRNDNTEAITTALSEFGLVSANLVSRETLVQYQSAMGITPPEKWEVLTIDELGEVILGGTPRTQIADYWNGDIPWMVSGDVHRGIIYDVPGRITQAGLSSSNATMVNPPAIAIALAGQGRTRGSVALTRIPLCTNQSIALIKPNEKRILASYLHYNLATRYNEIRSMSTAAAGRGGLNKKIIKSIRVAVPPIPEQRRICEILSKVISLLDEGIHIEKAIGLHLENLKKGLMHDLLNGKVRVRVW